MERGKILWYCKRRGYGFLESDNRVLNTFDVFFHKEDFENPEDIEKLKENKVVKFQRFNGIKGERAKKLVVI